MGGEPQKYGYPNQVSSPPVRAQLAVLADQTSPTITSDFRSHTSSGLTSRRDLQEPPNDVAQAFVPGVGTVTGQRPTVAIAAPSAAESSGHSFPLDASC